MKTLIIANSKLVFGRELKNELVEKNIDTSILDFGTLKLIDSQNAENTQYQELFDRYKGIPKISMFFRMFIIAKILNEQKYDIVNIHTSRWYYLLILGTLKKYKCIITFYGSDFYSTSQFIKSIQTPIYKIAYKISFTNPETMKSFLEYYNNFNNKTYVCRFGLKTLDFIDKNRGQKKDEIKSYLGYSLEKKIITCGYNAIPEQRHEEIISNILKLPLNILKNTQFIFPMTYGNDLHKEKIKKILSQTNLDYIILENFLYDDENAYIKLASDIMINIQDVDSFSGTMQEFLYADNIVITGSWLPYDLLDNEGIVYLKIDNYNELSIIIKDIYLNFIDIKNLKSNQSIIYELTSWLKNTKCWCTLYEN